MCLRIPIDKFFHTQICMYMYREGRFRDQHAEHRKTAVVSSLSCYPLELTPSFSVSTYGAMIMKFNELNRELKGLIQHHLQRCLDSGRYYY